MSSPVEQHATASQLNAIADRTVRLGLPRDVLDLLQLQFARRCRQLAAEHQGATTI